MGRVIRRRELIKGGLAGVGVLALGPAFWKGAVAAPARRGVGPYGPIGPADANGLRLPAGFTSRLIAQGEAPVLGTAYVWHGASDGSATYALDDGGWILVSNSEVPGESGDRGLGGASAIRFRSDGSIADAYRILDGTRFNCSGGKTPWNTWLSCEEVDTGLVWECDIFGTKPAVVHPAMGVFKHEAAAVDQDGRRVYLTEDVGDGAFYRFTPDRWPDLAAGVLELAKVAPSGDVEWVRVPDPSAATAPTRQQVPGYTVFRRGEGLYFDRDAATVYVAESSADRVHAYNTPTETMDVVFDRKAIEGEAPLADADNVTVGHSGDVFVCEDGGDLRVGLLTPEGEVATFMQLDPNMHAASESTGPSFDPSGKRFYISSQRFGAAGAIFEISGPFRTARPADKRPPALRVEAAPSVGRRRLRSRGLRVDVTTGEPGTATVLLRVPRAGRPPLMLARRGVRTDGRQAATVALRPGRRGRRRLEARRRKLDATLTILARDLAGNSRRATLPVVVRRGRRRRRPGRR